MIDNNSIQKVRELPIEQVAEALSLTVKRHKSLCPFHDDTVPSLTFNVHKNTFRCFVCDAHGGTIDLAMHMLNLKFADAVCWLAQSFGIVITEEMPVRFANITPRKVVPASKPSPLTPEPSPDISHLAMLIAQPYLCEEAQRFLFDERKLHPAVVKWLGISSISSPVPMSRDYRASWFNAPSLLIPYKDVDGKLLSVQARYLGKDAKPRFQFPRGSKCHIFNLPVLQLLKEDEELWITEGVSDCMAMLSSGKKAIAIPSATLLKDADVKLLHALNERLHTTFHIYPDQDAPGERLYLELKDRLPNIEHHQLPDGYKDFGQYWASR